MFIRQNKMIPMLTKIPENIEEKYENLDVILFCEDEIRDTYIDDGNVQNLKAKIEEGTLFINTDMNASYFTVYAEKMFGQRCGKWTELGNQKGKRRIL